MTKESQRKRKMENGNSLGEKHTYRRDAGSREEEISDEEV
jgi:hypothetical protein